MKQIEYQIPPESHTSMFAERFHKDGWKIICYDYFRKNYSDLKNKKKKLQELVETPHKPIQARRKPSKEDQTILTL